MERLPDSCVDDLNIPELAFLLASDLAVLDHHNGEVWLVANAINFDNTDERVDEAYADAAARVHSMTELLIQPTPAGVVSASFDQATLPIRRQRTPQEYQQAVSSAVEEIKAGEAFQIVVSQRFEVDTSADALDIYRVLRLTNPSPYMYLLRLDGFDIIGSSPEALVTVKGPTAVTHPIAGSKPRGATPAEDAALEAELLADPKERAEHVMLVDLGRNDLGRLRAGHRRGGGVHGGAPLQPHHASRVDGHRHDCGGLHRTRCCPGSLSGWDAVGAPKVRAMEIIDELEVSRRGLYGGVVGYWTLPVTPMLRSRFERLCCATVWPMYRPEAASSPTRTLHRRSGDPEQGCRGGSGHLRGRELHSGPASSSGRRSRALAFGCLLLGGGLALVGSAQPWWRAVGEGVVVKFSGTQATGGLSQALAIVALAGTLLMLALRTRGRRVIGALLLLVGAGIAVVGDSGCSPVPTRFAARCAK